MKKNRKGLALIIAPMALVAFGACSQVKDMHDATTKVAGTSERIANTSEDIATTSERIATTSENMAQDVSDTADTAGDTYYDLRQGNTENMRREALKRMEDAESFEEKASQAAVYHVAFEFQVWKGRGRDTPETLIKLYNEAMLEFFRDTREYSHNADGEIDPTSTNPDMQNVFALAVTMHKINLNSIVNQSVLSLIEDTLMKKNEILQSIGDSSDGWEKLPAYQQEILSSEKQAIYLLRARVNMLPMMVFDRLTHISNQGGIGRTWDYFFGTRADLEDLTYAEIKEMTTWMREANRNYAFFRDIGVNPKINTRLIKLYRRMEMPKNPLQEDAELSPDLNQLRTKALGDLLNEVDIFQKEIGN